MGRDPYVGRTAEALEGRGQNPDDRVFPSPERDGLAEDETIAAVAACPQPVTQEHDKISLRHRVFLGQERATRFRLDTEDSKIAAADDFAGQTFRLLRIGQIEDRRPVYTQIHEGMLRLTKRRVSGIRPDHVLGHFGRYRPARHRRDDLRDSQKAVGLAKRQAAQNRGIHDRIHSRVHAHADGHRKDRNCRKARLPSKGVADVP